MKNRSIAIAATIILTLTLATVALAADPFVGTWKLNVAKSKSTDPSLMPKSEITKNEGIDNGLKITIDGLDAWGKAYHIETSAKYDGKDYPVTGDPNMDYFAQKKIDPITIDEVGKKAGKEVWSGRSTVSKDGKMQTFRGKGMNSKGQEYSGT